MLYPNIYVYNNASGNLVGSFYLLLKQTLTICMPNFDLMSLLGTWLLKSFSQNYDLFYHTSHVNVSSFYLWVAENIFYYRLRKAEFSLLIKKANFFFDILLCSKYINIWNYELLYSKPTHYLLDCDHFLDIKFSLSSSEKFSGKYLKILINYLKLEKITLVILKNL